jgi:NADH-quinone oxidoreductase subunit L
MTVPLIILAIGSVIGGWFGIPKVLSFGRDINVFESWLAPAVAAAHGEAAEGAHAGAGLELALMGAALAIALAGIGVAYLIYRRREGSAAAIAQRFRPIYVMWRNLYWVDEFYEAVVIRPFYAISRFFTAFDRLVIDGLVNATGIVADITGQILKLFQTGYVRNYALLFLMGVVAILVYLASV